MIALYFDYSHQSTLNSEVDSLVNLYDYYNDDREKHPQYTLSIIYNKPLVLEEESFDSQTKVFIIVVNSFGAK
ncbi:hypothetical protein DERP_007032 [Dermatophagoides pteronyssinus]|uniref:Uncharacterized protein n=1 Tax=Dermatophagoides pteronyssinus TaxID=6956 RepID=A0ABQ8JU40_DERPT|nr:hypothetical protein DERP_007032 [Dermatophagoides pteronyssinus]